MRLYFSGFGGDFGERMACRAGCSRPPAVSWPRSWSSPRHDPSERIGEREMSDAEYRAGDADQQAKWVYDLLVVAELLDLDIDVYTAPDAEYVAAWVRAGCADENPWEEMSAAACRHRPVGAGTDQAEAAGGARRCGCPAAELSGSRTWSDQQDDAMSYADSDDTEGLTAYGDSDPGSPTELDGSSRPGRAANPTCGTQPGRQQKEGNPVSDLDGSVNVLQQWLIWLGWDTLDVTGVLRRRHRNSRARVRRKPVG